MIAYVLQESNRISALPMEKIFAAFQKQVGCSGSLAAHRFCPLGKHLIDHPCLPNVYHVYQRKPLGPKGFHVFYLSSF